MIRRLLDVGRALVSELDTEAVLDMHISSLRRKLGDDAAPEVAAWDLGAAWALQPGRGAYARLL